VELDAPAQVELQGVVVGGLPRLGQTGHQAAVAVALEQVVEDIVVDRQAGELVREIRVEALGVGLQIDGQLACWRRPAGRRAR
jgi:hypothetical protein